jgi:signal transduction histidine kinase
MCHLLGGQPAKLIINEREQFLSGFRLALRHPVKYLRDLAHRKRVTISIGRRNQNVYVGRGGGVRCGCRLDASRSGSEPTTRLAELVHVSLRGLDPQWEGRAVILDIPKDMPLIRADFVLLEQALNNLLLNAATHAPARTPVEVRALVSIWLPIPEVPVPADMT